MTNVGEKVVESLNKKKNDPNNFIWKGKKEVVDGKTIQNEYRLIDCSFEQLKEFYDYCDTMLYNEQPTKPGRVVLKALIKKQREACNAELFKRWITINSNAAPFKFVESSKEFISLNREKLPEESEITVGHIINCPREYVSLSLKPVNDACLAKLGKFDKSHITLRFLLDIGLWLSQKETKNLLADGASSREEAIIGELRLPKGTKFKWTSKGLSYAQFRAMVTLRSKNYSELTTLQLETLRDRLLFELEDDVDFHIDQWQKRKEQIIKVCELKGFRL